MQDNAEDIRRYEVESSDEDEAHDASRARRQVHAALSVAASAPAEAPQNPASPDSANPAAQHGWGAALADPARGELPRPAFDIFAASGCKGKVHADFYKETWAPGLGSQHLRRYYHARLYTCMRAHLPATLHVDLKERSCDAWHHLELAFTNPSTGEYLCNCNCSCPFVSAEQQCRNFITAFLEELEILGHFRTLTVAGFGLLYAQYKRHLRQRAGSLQPPRDVLPALTAYPTWHDPLVPPQLLRRREDAQYRARREGSG